MFTSCCRHRARKFLMSAATCDAAASHLQWLRVVGKRALTSVWLQLCSLSSWVLSHRLQVCIRFYPRLEHSTVFVCSVAVIRLSCSAVHCLQSILQCSLVLALRSCAISALQSAIRCLQSSPFSRLIAALNLVCCRPCLNESFISAACALSTSGHKHLTSLRSDLSGVLFE